MSDGRRLCSGRLDQIVHRLTEARLRAYDPVILQWQGDDVRRRLEAETRTLLRRTTDAQLGSQAMAHFPELGITDPSAFLDAVIELPGGRIALAGIRFRGGDRDRPFVDVLALDGDPDDDAMAAILQRWKVFAPRCLRLSVPSPEPAHSRVDMLVIAGRIADTVDRVPGRCPELRIEAATDLSWYAAYREEYEQFLAGDAQRRQWTHPESHESLDRTRREGGVFVVRLNGAVAGIYAMERACAHGLRGFRVQEKLLFGNARGRGLGAIAEHAVIGSLAADPDDVVFGSIEVRNLASQRAAYRLGRRAITARLWIPPPGLRSIADRS